MNGVLLNARAIDDRKAAEELLLRSEARFKALVQNNSDLVLVIDAHERVNRYSPSSLHLVGEEADALFGRQLSGLWSTRLGVQFARRSRARHDLEFDLHNGPIGGRSKRWSPI
ncbi:MAG: hypothetical protein R2789_04660 [Microthrixaceae bacterium]